MKTLIINGSPKKHGDTDALVREFCKHLRGEVMVVSIEDGIAPCCDCRVCWTHAGCAVQDKMQAVYPFLQTCDTIVLASPIWFSSLSGVLLNICSRIQTLWAAGYFRKEDLCMRPKEGVIIMVGAQEGTEVIPTQNALTIMRYMNVRREGVEMIYSLDTNNVPAHEDESALARCRAVAEGLNAKAASAADALA